MNLSNAMWRSRICHAGSKEVSALEVSRHQKLGGKNRQKLSQQTNGCAGVASL